MGSLMLDVRSSRRSPELRTISFPGSSLGAWGPLPSLSPRWGTACLFKSSAISPADGASLVSAPFQWNAPRNDRPSRGRTIVDASNECAEATAGFELVIFMDDAITGTRFVKLFDALLNRIGQNRFLPIAMMFRDTFRPETLENPNRDRLAKRVGEQGQRLGYPNALIEFPLQRLFRVDAAAHVRWESPVIWGESDLIAGKRKVNLVFTLLDHCFGLLDDLGAEESAFRPYLEHAWRQDTTGSVSLLAPGLVRSVFRAIVNDLPLDEIQSNLWQGAKARFPDDYTGRIVAMSEEDVKERWDWLGDAFLREAEPRIGEQRASVARRAIDDTFAASFAEHKPWPSRDQDAAPYTFPFNKTITALNGRLRARICEAI
jgi:hypothetical protein